MDVSHVLVSGDMPDLRSLTGPLMHELNVEVETLDVLEGIDVAHLPEPVDEFRANVGDFKVVQIDRDAVTFVTSTGERRRVTLRGPVPAGVGR
ncbi:MAG: hypothetical protein NT151_01545 [Acidobacteria bacterium]|nr:hypothetical protein [Acidobacteriota bacterium]